MQAKKTILIFPFNLLSHYLRCLVLADTYSKEEYKIYFLNSGIYDQYVLQQGYETFYCRQFNANHVMECAHQFEFSWLNEIDLEKVMLAQVEVIRALKADMVIGDVAPTLKMAASLTGTIHLSLLNGYLTKYYTSTRKISRTHKAYSLLKLLPEPIADLLTNYGEKITFKKIQEPFNVLRKKYGLEKVPDYLSEIEGDKNLICDLPALFPQSTLPPNYASIGPLIYQYQREHSLWLEELTPFKPVICVCMGSTGDWNKLKFLNDSYYSKYTIVTAGDRQKVLSGSHIISRTFVNLEALLKKSALMICHGGNGTMYSGIVNQVYMLCLSSHFEQEWNIDALAQAGFGKSANDFNEVMWKAEIAIHCICTENQLEFSRSFS